MSSSGDDEQHQHHHQQDHHHRHQHHQHEEEMARIVRRKHSSSNRHHHRLFLSAFVTRCTSFGTATQVICLVITIIGFVLLNQQQWQRIQERRGGGGGTLRGSTTTATVTTTLREQWINSNELNEQQFNYQNVAQNTNHLIIVAGHSVTISGHLEDAEYDEHDWFLLEYQKHRGLPTAIIRHIKAGIDAAIHDPLALLIFSGGQTRAITGPESEGASYYRVADAMQLWTPIITTTDNNNNNNNTNYNNHLKNDTQARGSSTVRARTITEEFATDSFENLLFSICRFHEVTGSYPTKITMVSFTFKEHRFKTLHVPAIRYPYENFFYIGVDPPVSTGFNLQEAINGELQNAAKPFETDPYGCHTPALQEKRRSRNPFFRIPPYSLSCPDMREIFNYCGPDIISKEKVPW